MQLPYMRFMYSPFSRLNLVVSCRTLVVSLACACTNTVFAIGPIQGCLIDSTRNLIVCPLDSATTVEAWIAQRLESQFSLDTTGIHIATADVELNTTYRVVRPGEAAYTLNASSFPLISITANDSINAEEKVETRLSLGLPDAETQVFDVGVEWRGFSGLGYAKKNYDIKVRRGRELRVPGLRADDDWVLNGMPDEPQRLNSYIAQKLWIDLGRRPESFREAAAVGPGARFIELAVNGDYRGLYLASEQIDRELLDLLKAKPYGTREGELFKAGFWSDATLWFAAPDYDNSAANYYQWEQKYPRPTDGNIDYAGLHEVLDFVVNAGDEAFRNNVQQYFDVENIVDYFLFVNLISARDNTGTNTYLARSYSEAPWTILPWDLDATFGMTWSVTYQPLEPDQVLSNGLLRRLLVETDGDFSARVAQRYQSLRATWLTPENMAASWVAGQDLIESSGAAARENERWAYEELPLRYQPSLERPLAEVGRRFDLLDRLFGQDSTVAVVDPLPQLARPTISPNPVSQATRIHVSDAPGWAPDRSLRIYSFSGRHVHSIRMLGSEATVDLTHLARGSYILAGEGIEATAFVRQ